MKTKKSLKNIFLFVLALCFVFFLNAGLPYAFAEESVRCEEKEYWNGSLDETIDCQNLLVVVDKYHSGINKVHNDAFFGGFQKTHVTDLTAVEGDRNMFVKKASIFIPYMQVLRLPFGILGLYVFILQ